MIAGHNATDVWEYALLSIGLGGMAGDVPPRVLVDLATELGVRGVSARTHTPVSRDATRRCIGTTALGNTVL